MMLYRMYFFGLVNYSLMMSYWDIIDIVEHLYNTSCNLDKIGLQ